MLGLTYFLLPAPQPMEGTGYLQVDFPTSAQLCGALSQTHPEICLPGAPKASQSDNEEEQLCRRTLVLLVLSLPLPSSSPSSSLVLLLAKNLSDLFDFYEYVLYQTTGKSRQVMADKWLCPLELVYINHLFHKSFSL